MGLLISLLRVAMELAKANPTPSSPPSQSACESTDWRNVERPVEASLACMGPYLAVGTEAFPKGLRPTPPVPEASHYVVFDHCMDYLCKEIDKADSVFGCAYFFSHKGVVRALQGKVCSIVMNKGAYAFKDNAQLQRFTTKGQTWRSTEGHQFILDFLSPEPVDAVRCFGTTQPERLLHNKFMVLCTTQDGIHTPQAVWTGSANFTALASDHHSENGILLRDPALAYEYVKCWARHYVLSEPLDDDPPKGVRPTLYYDWYGRNANMDTAASPTSKTTDEVKKEVDAVAVKMTTATLDDKEQKETDATRNPDKDLTSVGSPLTRKTLERVKTRCIACLGEHSVLPSELNRRQRCGKCYVAWTREQESSRIHKYTKGSKQ